MRSSDVSVVNLEAARERLHRAQEALECELRQKEDLKKKEEEEAGRLTQEDLDEAIQNPENTKVIREVEMVRGKMVREEHMMKKLTREVVMVEGRMVSEYEGDKELSAKN